MDQIKQLRDKYLTSYTYVELNRDNKDLLSYFKVPSKLVTLARENDLHIILEVDSVTWEIKKIKAFSLLDLRLIKMEDVQFTRISEIPFKSVEKMILKNHIYDDVSEKTFNLRELELLDKYSDIELLDDSEILKLLSKIYDFKYEE